MSGRTTKRKPLTLGEFSQRAGGYEKVTILKDELVTVHFVDAKGRHHRGYVTDLKLSGAMAPELEIRVEEIA